MGYTIEAIREVGVDPGAIFDLYMDPSTWSVWGHNVRWARSDGPLADRVRSSGCSLSLEGEP